MSYTLIHTAEQIDHKLSLVNENKNLLPYPYKAVFPVGLEDVGDGSILISATSIPILSENTLVTSCSLPAGKKYIISLSVTNLVNEVNITDHAIQLVVDIAGRTPITLTKDNTYTVLDLSTATQPVTVTIYLGKGTPAVNADALIKPQIEEGTEKTAWVPYMKTISSYVDERFNGTNAKIKVLTERLNALEQLLANTPFFVVKE